MTTVVVKEVNVKVNTQPIQVGVDVVSPFVSVKTEGTQGIKGDPGEGSFIFTGTGVPSSSLGENGDFYIDSTGGSYYSKIAGSWVYQGSFGGTSDHTLLLNIGTNTHAQIDSHIGSTSNPHSVTKSQVGLGSVDNTSDVNKPVSNPQYELLINMLLGTGEDGDVIISGTTTLARNTFYNNLTITGTGILRPAGFSVYVKGTLTINPGGVIDRLGGDGGNGGNTGAAGTAGAAVTQNEFGSSTAGSAGAVGTTGAGAQAANVSGSTSYISAQAGSGGFGGNGASAGGIRRNGSSTTYRPNNTIPFFPGYLYAASVKTASQSAPGGASGGGSGSNNGGGGGGGGSGGGGLIIFCDSLDNQGTISVAGGNGGNGGSPTTGNCGGGGGGGGGTGGAIFIICKTVTNLGTLNISGGTGGAGGSGSGGGSAGEAGTAGTAGKYRVYELSTDTWMVS